MTAYDVGSGAVVRAADPFYSKDANVILRTVDDVEFRVHKYLIKLAAPALAALISLAPYQTSSSSSRTQRRLLNLPQTSDVLDTFLRFVYPVEEPSLGLDDIAALLELANRYSASGVIARMRTHLLLPEHLETDPTTVYALASYAGLKHVARTAARRTLAHPTPAQLAGVRLLQGTALVQLLQYRKSCTRAAEAVTRAKDAVPSWIQMRWRKFCFLSECGTCTGERKRLAWNKALHGCVSVSYYWVEYMGGVSMALRDRLDPSIARDPALVLPAVEAGLKCCARCAAKIVWDMEEFSRILEEVLDEAISSVKIEDNETHDEYSADETMTPRRKRYLLPSYDYTWPFWDTFWALFKRGKLLDSSQDLNAGEGDEEDAPDDLTTSWAPPSEV
ncbi:hypothetical protein FKP32DRAFT_1594627 [Trametes sanguinea]|nr:hypothetical protein FKP32DRAFT_1594627 [Trametes sanguinea]